MEIKFIIWQMKRRKGRVNHSKLCCPTSVTKGLLFKDEFRSSVSVCDGMHVSE
jgi:hypothetical protein